MKDNSLTRKLLAEYRNVQKEIRKYWYHYLAVLDPTRERIKYLVAKKDELKSLLDKLPNIPNKKESRKLRQKAAKR